MLSNLKKWFFSGLLFWIPLIITIVIVKVFITIAAGLIARIPPQYLPSAYLPLPYQSIHSYVGINIILILLFILVTGFLFNLYLGKRLIGIWDKSLSRIPLIRTIYYAVKQSISAVATNSNFKFNRVVLIEYPRKEMWSIGFITNDDTKDFNPNNESDKVSVYIPTTPNPTSGYIVLVDKNDVHPIKLTAEEAFKWIISLGLINPKDKIEDTHHDT